MKFSHQSILIVFCCMGLLGSQAPLKPDSGGSTTSPPTPLNDQEPKKTTQAPPKQAEVARSGSISAPVILDGIKYSDQERQGSLTRATCRRLGIPTVPIAYHGGVDWNQDGTITKSDINQFRRWIDSTLPRNQTGLIVMDYEQPWWTDLSATELEPVRLQEILGVYSRGLGIAQEIRPAMTWGYWGLPNMRNLSPGWKEQGLSVTPLMMQQGAIFPAAYDCTPGNNSDVFRRYVVNAIASVKGRRTAWVFINTRFCGQNKDRTKFIPIDEILKNVEAILDATWTAEDGTVHRAAGVIVWDTYGWTQEEGWPALDQHNAELFSKLHALAVQMRGDPPPDKGEKSQSPSRSGSVP